MSNTLRFDLKNQETQLPKSLTLTAEVRIIRNDQRRIFFTYGEGPSALFIFPDIVIGDHVVQSVEDVEVLRETHPLKHSILMFFEFLKALEEFKKNDQLAEITIHQDSDGLYPAYNIPHQKGSPVPILELIANMIEGKVRQETIALIISDSSPNKNNYSKEDIDLLYRFYQDTKDGKPLVTPQQCEAILEFQKGFDLPEID